MREFGDSRCRVRRVSSLAPSPRTPIAITARDARPVTRPIRHWLLTGVSFAAVLGVSAYMVAEWWDQGSLTLPLRSHLLAALTVSLDRKSTRLNSSHDQISYAVF